MIYKKINTKFLKNFKKIPKNKNLFLCVLVLIFIDNLIFEIFTKFSLVKLKYKYNLFYEFNHEFWFKKKVFAIDNRAKSSR